MISIPSDQGTQNIKKNYLREWTWVIPTQHCPEFTPSQCLWITYDCPQRAICDIE